MLGLTEAMLGLKKTNDKAINDYNEAIRLDPKNAQAWSNRGNTQFEKGEYEKAINDYSEAIHLEPKEVFPWFNRGLLGAKKVSMKKPLMTNVKLSV